MHRPVSLYTMPRLFRQNRGKVPLHVQTTPSNTTRTSMNHAPESIEAEKVEIIISSSGSDEEHLQPVKKKTARSSPPHKASKSSTEDVIILSSESDEESLVKKNTARPWPPQTASKSSTEKVILLSSESDEESPVKKTTARSSPPETAIKSSTEGVIILSSESDGEIPVKKKTAPSSPPQTTSKSSTKSLQPVKKKTTRSPPGLSKERGPARVHVHSKIKDGGLQTTSTFNTKSPTSISPRKAERVTVHILASTSGKGTAKTLTPEPSTSGYLSKGQGTGKTLSPEPSTSGYMSKAVVPKYLEPSTSGCLSKADPNNSKAGHKRRDSSSSSEDSQATVLFPDRVPSSTKCLHDETIIIDENEDEYMYNELVQLDETDHGGSRVDRIKQRYGTAIENVNERVKFVLGSTLVIDTSITAFRYRTKHVMSEILHDTIASIGTTYRELPPVEGNEETCVTIGTLRDTPRNHLVLGFKTDQYRSCHHCPLNPIIMSAQLGTVFFTLDSNDIQQLTADQKVKILWHLICRYVAGICSVETVIKVSLLVDRNNFILGHNLHWFERDIVKNGNLFELLLPSISYINSMYSRVLADALDYLKHDAIIKQRMKDIMFEGCNGQYLTENEYSRLKKIYDLF